MDDCPILFNAVRVPTGSDVVVDADEEVFLLYSELQRKHSSVPSEQFRGLGHVDSRKDLMTVSIELKGNDVPNDMPIRALRSERKRSRGKAKDRVRHIDDKTVEVVLAQDITALRSRKGDTGSVLWHASIDFARLVLQQAHLKSPDSLFDFDKLKHQHILELGAGTGILCLLLSSLCKRYTVTDIPDLMPLIRKNISLNPSAIPESTDIHPQPIDWVLVNDTPHSRRRALLSLDVDVIDVILVVDCIYHPSLLPPLVGTIDYLATPGQTAVVVVSELRSEEVIREFLELWLAIGTWVVRRIPGHVLPGPYAIWFGWKEAPHEV